MSRPGQPHSQAKGILMERYKITADDAFRLLVATSSRTNRKLVAIADELCAAGAMPAPAPGRRDGGGR
ncbi:ANTAR domain-containing protein [Trujillonella humicola]|uniref:ANTAR domain-containing protein n=1 Tax=Trujillonella humicola TaxID=3383699 RepID=UPI00390623B5